MCCEPLLYRGEAISFSGVTDCFVGLRPPRNDALLLVSLVNNAQFGGPIVVVLCFDGVAEDFI